MDNPGTRWLKNITLPQLIKTTKDQQPWRSMIANVYVVDDFDLEEIAHIGELGLCPIEFGRFSSRF